MVGREVGIPTAGFALFGFYYHEACLPSWMQNLCPLHLPACASLPLTLFSSYSLVAQMVKNLPAMWKICIRSLGQEGPLEKGMATHSLENSMDRGAWWATVHGVTKSWTRLSDLLLKSLV